MRKKDERGTFSLGIVMGGTVLALAIAFIAGVLLPVTDSALGSEASGSARRYSEAALQGRKIYVREGCFTCHTQMVRDTETDRSLGSDVSRPGDYGNEAPNLIGLDRLGPDLTCAGDREKDIAIIVKHLRRPSSIQPGTTMPSYAYLTSRELNALAAYIVALHCGGNG